MSHRAAASRTLAAAAAGAAARRRRGEDDRGGDSPQQGHVPGHGRGVALARLRGGVQRGDGRLQAGERVLEGAQELIWLSMSD